MSAIRSEKCESTSYGVARLPYTIRLANRPATCRSGWNTRAMTTAATIVRNEFPRLPTAVPTPITIATYTPVRMAASTPYRTALLMMTSMS